MVFVLKVLALTVVCILSSCKPLFAVWSAFSLPGIHVRAEFPLLEANLPSHSFISMDSIMPMCTTSLYHFDRVTDTEISKPISGMNKTTCISDPFPTRLLMSHLHAIIPILQHTVNLCLTMGDFRFLVNHLL